MVVPRPRHLLALQQIPLFFDEHHGVQLVGGHLVEAHCDAEFHRGTKIERPANQLTWLRGLCGVEAVEWAVITPATVVRRIRAEAGIAKFLPAQCPMNEEPQGGLLGPLPACQFGPALSWNPASSASMAAFTATAWWMMGTAPA